MRTACVYILLLCSLFTTAAPLRIVSYNVENLFHPDRDSLYNDTEWIPDGTYRWSFKRYYRKIDHIARVLTNIGEWDGVDIVGLCEIENAQVVKHLCRALGYQTYRFVHYDSPDRRGIDVALIYHHARIDTLRTRTIPVRPSDHAQYQGRTLVTRDILYVCAQHRPTHDTLHLFVCHLPSQRGGATESAWKRQLAKTVLQSAIDSVLRTDNQARIIVMGDMNMPPQQDLLPLKNKMLHMAQGTHRFHGQWTCLDQFYTSPAIDSVSTTYIFDAPWIMEHDEQYLGLKPKRTYNGVRYQNGYSDHLPIVLIVNP